MFFRDTAQGNNASYEITPSTSGDIFQTIKGSTNFCTWNKLEEQTIPSFQPEGKY